MSAQGAVPRKLFDVELPVRVGDLLRTVEARARRPLVEIRGEQADVGAAVGFFDDAGTPHIALAPGGGAPSLEAVVLEVVRLWLRNNRFEKNMPYAEMRHPANQRLCRRLYRILEQEIVASECETLGVAVREWMRGRLTRLFLDPLGAGKYRPGEADPGRVREGALDALEAAIAEADERAARRLGIFIAQADAAIARPFGLMYKVVEQHRPFDGEDRIRAAYYLAVPFLFDARKPASPIQRARPS